MEHRRKYKYKGYEIAIFISHTGDLTVDVNKDGELVDGCFGNMVQAESYIDNLDFEATGILITGGSAYGTTNIRVTPEVFKTIIEDPRLRAKDFSVVGNTAHLLGNSAEYAVIQDAINVDLHEWEADWFKVYYE